MISETKMFGAKCDGCGEEWDNGDSIAYYPDKELTECSIKESGWHIREDGKTYCPECWSYDDNDNLVFKNPTSTNEHK